MTDSPPHMTAVQYGTNARQLQIQMTDQNHREDDASMGEKLQDRQEELLADVQDGLTASRNQSTRENLRESLHGWREIGGMTLGAAVAVDLVSIMFGVAAWLELPGLAGLFLGLGLVGLGGVGLVEKLLRRVISR